MLLIRVIGNCFPYYKVVQKFCQALVFFILSVTLPSLAVTVEHIHELVDSDEIDIVSLLQGFVQAQAINAI